MPLFSPQWPPRLLVDCVLASCSIPLPVLATVSLSLILSSVISLVSCWCGVDLASTCFPLRRQVPMLHVIFQFWPLVSFLVGHPCDPHHFVLSLVLSFPSPLSFSMSFIPALAAPVPLNTLEGLVRSVIELAGPFFVSGLPAFESVDDIFTKYLAILTPRQATALSHLVLTRPSHQQVARRLIDRLHPDTRQILESFLAGTHRLTPLERNQLPVAIMVCFLSCFVGTAYMPYFCDFCGLPNASLAYELRDSQVRGGTLSHLSVDLVYVDGTPRMDFSSFELLALVPGASGALAFP